MTAEDAFDGPDAIESMAAKSGSTEPPHIGWATAEAIVICIILDCVDA